MLKPINQEQVQQTSQVMLAFLSEESVSIPGNLLEGIVSGKSLLRGIIQGQLLVCQNAKGEAVAAPSPAPEADVETDVEVDEDPVVEVEVVVEDAV